MKQLEKARAMKCFGRFAEMVELDPDPKTQDKLQKEFNCRNCVNWKYCCQLAETLKPMNEHRALIDIATNLVKWDESHKPENTTSLSIACSLAREILVANNLR